MYSTIVAPSGFGKNQRISILERLITKPMMKSYNFNIFKELTARTLNSIIDDRIKITGKDYEEVHKEVYSDYEVCGSYYPLFEEATPAALRQVVRLIKLSGFGSINMMCDEIGLNLSKVSDSLTHFLSSFDRGEVKDKILKSTKDSVRSFEVDGLVQSNLILFGTEDELLLNSKVHKDYIALLKTGFARRMNFCVEEPRKLGERLSEEGLIKAEKELIQLDSDSTTVRSVEEVCCINNVGKRIKMSKDAYILYLTTRQESKFDQKDSESQVMSSFKKDSFIRSLRMAGAISFFLNEEKLSKEVYQYCLDISKESELSLEKVINVKQPYIQLAIQLANINEWLTYHQIEKVLPLFKGVKSHKNEMISMAISYSKTSNIKMIEKEVEGVKFVRAVHTSTASEEPSNIQGEFSLSDPVEFDEPKTLSSEESQVILDKIKLKLKKG